MKKATKAVLLSGLVFPGVGHLVLKLRGRGWALVLTALIAIGAVVTISAQTASDIADRILSGEIPMDSASINEAVSDASNSAHGFPMNVALILFGICWVIGVVDSYRQGVVADRSGD